ncbi:MAG: UDP-N-acetylmuramate--L-alanine ligase, partial [Flavobacteriales bacterium]|nr:UDP-N-acetylmuramate--L-alanine ligase [Flavobacteriales bacterium]
MTRFDHIRYVYLIGIGGIGMSGLARYFKHHGKTVAGYDKTETPLTHLLNSEGIIVNYLDDVQGIPAEITSSNADEVLVIITPAIPQANEQLKYFISRGTTLHKRSEVLGLITTDYSTLAVAGTHGKTTTSSILAHLMHHAGMPTTAFIGGIMKNYQSNVLLSEEQKWMIVEADEYDRSFLRLKPRIATVTSMDADHLDIYGSADGMRDTYREFTQLIDREG